jgi:hypothetical protein
LYRFSTSLLRSGEESRFLLTNSEQFLNFVCVAGYLRGKKSAGNCNHCHCSGYSSEMLFWDRSNRPQQPRGFIFKNDVFKEKQGGV